MMTREQQRQLKEIDTDILRTALMLTGLLQRRAQVDVPSTSEFLDGMILTWRTAIGRVEARKRSNDPL